MADDFAIGSAAMGDALTGATLGTIVTDRYDRAYTFDIGGRTQNAAPVPRLRGAVEQGGYTSAAVQRCSFASSDGWRNRPRAAGLGWAPALQLTPEDAFGARVIAARIAARIAPDTQFGIALRQSAAGLVAQMQGADRAAFMVAPEAGRDAGFLETSELAFASRHQFGDLGLTVSGEVGRAWLGENRRASDVLYGVRERRATRSMSVAADRSWGGLDASLALSWMSEEETLLGGFFNPAFGLSGADTMFVDGRLVQRIGAGWRVGGSYRAGFTRPRGSALIGDGSQIATQGWSLDLTRRGLFQRGDAIGVRLSQPLRVTGGALNFDLPVGYDYATESAILGRQTLNLTPEGREVMSELNWTWLDGRYEDFNQRLLPHAAGAFCRCPSDIGALLTLGAQF